MRAGAVAEEQVDDVLAPDLVLSESNPTGRRARPRAGWTLPQRRNWPGALHRCCPKNPTRTSLADRMREVEPLKISPPWNSTRRCVGGALPITQAHRIDDVSTCRNRSTDDADQIGFYGDVVMGRRTI